MPRQSRLYDLRLVKQQSMKVNCDRNVLAGFKRKLMSDTVRMPCVSVQLHANTSQWGHVDAPLPIDEQAFIDRHHGVCCGSGCQDIKLGNFSHAKIGPSTEFDDPNEHELIH